MPDQLELISRLEQELFAARQALLKEGTQRDQARQAAVEMARMVLQWIEAYSISKGNKEGAGQYYRGYQAAQRVLDNYEGKKIMDHPFDGSTIHTAAHPIISIPGHPDYRLNEHYQELEAKYHELLYAVASKFPGETRHQTALRYIQNAEHRDNSPAQRVIDGKETP